jgi:hypothetical protein
MNNPYFGFNVDVDSIGIVGKDDRGMYGEIYLFSSI